MASEDDAVTCDGDKNVFIIINIIITATTTTTIITCVRYT